MKPWVTLFSQTGTEIYNISQKLERYPDIIITNSNNVNPALVKSLPITTQYIELPSRPSIDDYYSVIPNSAFITLHGWLRIIPAVICEKYEIYNLHPANLILHPHLKGKDPQVRAVKELQEKSGNTIHRCTSELDGGQIILTSTVNIEGLFEFEAIHQLHIDATNLWLEFLRNHLK